jgi:hypothetical protein
MHLKASSEVSRSSKWMPLVIRLCVFCDLRRATPLNFRWADDVLNSVEQDGTCLAAIKTALYAQYLLSPPVEYHAEPSTEGLSRSKV